jgi:hypothetical protein
MMCAQEGRIPTFAEAGGMRYAVALGSQLRYPFGGPPDQFSGDCRMAEHGTVEYATADGNDYPTHEASYERFVFFTFVGIIEVINIVFGLTIGGVHGHWLLAFFAFVIGTIGAIVSAFGGSKTPSYVAFVLCFLIFVYTGLA